MTNMFRVSDHKGWWTTTATSTTTTTTGKADEKPSRVPGSIRYLPPVSTRSGRLTGSSSFLSPSLTHSLPFLVLPFRAWRVREIDSYFPESCLRRERVHGTDGGSAWPPIDFFPPLPGGVRYDSRHTQREAPPGRWGEEKKGLRLIRPLLVLLGHPMSGLHTWTPVWG